MSWAIGYDGRWKRDIGYGVPAYCDHPGCNEEIDRGLAHVCGGEPYGVIMAVAFTSAASITTAAGVAISANGVLAKRSTSRFNQNPSIRTGSITSSPMSRGRNGAM
jgi:hypothetical protein